MSTRRLAIVGYSGRMGTELAALATDFDFEIVAGVGRARKMVDGVQVYEKIELIEHLRPEVVIDFSLPEMTASVAAFCAAKKIPLVSGVTGLSTDLKQAIMATSESAATLWAPNMSLGVAVVARMLAEFSRLEGFDFQIEELHHTRKKDKPSGTAVFLQEKLKAAVGPSIPEPLAIRGGGIFGIHRVWAMGEEETITLEHTAMNRRVFARGALKAAQWILTQPPGLYTLNDVLQTS